MKKETDKKKKQSLPKRFVVVIKNKFIKKVEKERFDIKLD